MGQPLPARRHGSLILPPLCHPLHRFPQCCLQHLRSDLRPVDGGAEVLHARPATRRGTQVRRTKLHRRMQIDLRLHS